MRRQPSLRSQLNQIRLWVRQGRTDAWIAHKLDVSIEQLERFKRDHDLDGGDSAPGRPADPLSVPPPDLYELEDAEPEEEADEEEEAAGTLLEEPEGEPELATEAGDEERADDGRPGETRDRSRRRRGRRGGRRRRRPPAFEATFDHGEEGYGLWLDPSVVENPIYAEHWAGHRAVVVTFDRDSITIRRADGGGAEDSEDQ